MYGYKRDQNYNIIRMALQIQKILSKGLLAGMIVVILSFLLPLVPCTKAAVVATPEYKLGMCKFMNPFGEPIVGLSQKFYGAYTDPMAGLIIQFIVGFAIFAVLFLFLHKKRKKKIIDLTNK